MSEQNSPQDNNHSGASITDIRSNAVQESSVSKLTGEQLESFAEALRKAGLKPDEPVIADGGVHRCSVNKIPLLCNDGWYVLFPSKNPVGVFGDLKQGSVFKWPTESTADEHADEGNELLDGITPWPDPVNGVELANELVSTFRKYNILPEHGYEAAALWVMQTYVYNSFRILAKLLVWSPEKRCGKTTMLEVLESCVNSGHMISNTTGPALFRLIEAQDAVTLILDEADRYIRSNEDLVSIINSGHSRRSASVIRTEQRDGRLSPVIFSTWAPQVIGMIGKPDGTIIDRSISLGLQRSPNALATPKVPIDLFEQNSDLRRKLKRWGEDHSESLRAITPDIPEVSNTRAMDNWGPLLSIADELDGDWSLNAREAMLALEGDETHSEESQGVMLLQDIQKAFDGAGRDRMHTSDLIESLAANEERPWADFSRGKPISPRALSDQLKLFQVRSSQIKIGGKNRNGYVQADFENAFKSYLPEPGECDSKTLQLFAAGSSAVEDKDRNNSTSTLSSTFKTSDDGA